MTKPYALIAGAGSGFGTALVQAFHSNGYKTVGVTRSGNGTGIEGAADHALDLSDETAVQAFIKDHGVPDVVVHNTALFEMSPLAETETQRFEDLWRSMTLSAFILAKTTLPAMAERGSGAFLISGATASVRGGAQFSAFASAKFALRGLAQSLAREYQPQGVHISHVVIDGVINTPWSRERIGLPADRMIDPGELASAYVDLARQPKSTWTFELDLRPMTETF